MDDSLTKKIAEKLVIQFKERGFIVQRYDASSSNSIYLKLDYGVSNSIRISDHKGNSRYMFKIRIWIAE